MLLLNVSKSGERMEISRKKQHFRNLSSLPKKLENDDSYISGDRVATRQSMDTMKSSLDRCQGNKRGGEGE